MTHISDQNIKTHPMPDRLNTAPREVWKLPPDEVHVWVARLDEIARQGESLKETLSEEESKIAGRFYFEQDRIRYVTGVGVLRSILGFYLSTDPGKIEFGREKRNKPVLSGKFARINFNMSRSKGLAIYTFAGHRSVGVDVEEIKPMRDMDGIVRCFFAPGEIQFYAGLPATARTETFFRCWTRKEAFLKATGDGLFRPLNSFSVSLLPYAESHVMDAAGNHPMAPRFLLRDLRIEKGFMATVAVEGFKSLSPLPGQKSRLDETLSRLTFQGVTESTETSPAAAG